MAADPESRIVRAIARSDASTERLRDALAKLDAAVESCNAIPIHELDDEDSLVTAIDEAQQNALVDAARAKRITKDFAPSAMPVVAAPHRRG